MEAVGVPLPTLRKANLAEAVAVAPRRTSSVTETGARAPLFLCQLPTMVGSDQAALPPLSEVRTYPETGLLARVNSSVQVRPLTTKAPSVGLMVLIPTLPLLAMTKRGVPEAEAAKMGPELF